MQQTTCQIVEVEISKNDTEEKRNPTASEIKSVSSETEPLSVRDSPPVLVETEKFGSEPDSDMLTEHELTGNIFCSS